MPKPIRRRAGGGERRCGIPCRRAIIQARGCVRNLTTGAGIWLAGALGVTAGFGYIAIGLGAVLPGILGIAVLRVLEPKPEKEPD